MTQQEAQKEAQRQASMYGGYGMPMVACKHWGVIQVRPLQEHIKIADKSSILYATYYPIKNRAL